MCSCECLIALCGCRCAAITVVLAVAGFCMVLVGAFALFSLKTKNTLLLKVVELLDVALLCFVLGAAIIGLMLGLDMRDPIRETTTRAWGEFSSPNNAQNIWRQSFWDGKVCETNLVEVCDTNFAGEAVVALGSGHSNYTSGKNRIAHLFADCDYAYRGYQCITREEDTPTCAGRNLNGNPLEDKEQCESLVSGTYNGCRYVPAAGDTQESCVPAPDCAAPIALKGFCETCNRECQEFAIEQVKGNLLPAAHIIYGVFAFCVICIVVNDHLTAPDGMDGSWKNLGLLFNGLVSFTGFGLCIAAGVGQYYMAEDCPGTSMTDCTSPAIIVVVVLGAGLLVLGGLATFIIYQGITGVAEVVALAPINLAMVGVALPLLVCGLFLSIVAGGIDTVNTTFDKHYPEMRKAVEARDSDYCQERGPEGGLVPMTDEDCRAKMTEALEAEILFVGAVALCTALGILFVTIVTKHIATAWSRADDDGMTLNPLDEE